MGLRLYDCKVQRSGILGLWGAVAGLRDIASGRRLLLLFRSINHHSTLVVTLMVAFFILHRQVNP